MKSGVSGEVHRDHAPGRERFGRDWTLPYGQWPRATGDWGGVRTGLESLGLTIGGENIFEMNSVWDGSVHQRASNRNLLTIDAELDLEKTVRLAGGTTFIQFLSVTAEKGVSADAGDIQVYSNIENDRSLGVIYELWGELLLLNDRLRIKAGKVDTNSEFNYIDAGGEFDRFNGGTDDTTAGFYLTAEQRILAPDGVENDRGLYLFGQYGWADEQVSEFQHHVAGGIVERSMVLGRESDAAGIHMSFVDLSDEPGAGFERNEVVIDSYYRWQVTGAIFVQPETRYILNPSGSAAVDDAVVGGLRAGVSF